MTSAVFQQQVNEYIAKAKKLAASEHTCGDYEVRFYETPDAYTADVFYRGRKMFVIKHQINTARFTVEKIFSEELYAEQGSRVERRKCKVFDFLPPPKKRGRKPAAVPA